MDRRRGEDNTTTRQRTKSRGDGERYHVMVRAIKSPKMQCLYRSLTVEDGTYFKGFPSMADTAGGLDREHYRMRGRGSHTPTLHVSSCHAVFPEIMS